jgi:hypothetical protein
MLVLMIVVGLRKWMVAKGMIKAPASPRRYALMDVAVGY